jgi:hypothetical protein
MKVLFRPEVIVRFKNLTFQGYPQKKGTFSTSLTDYPHGYSKNVGKAVDNL